MAEYGQKDVMEVIENILGSQCRQAKVFTGRKNGVPTLAVRATRVRKHDDPRQGTRAILLTVGRLNYAERQLVKKLGAKTPRLAVKG